MIPHEFQWREGLGAKVELRTSEAAGAVGEHVAGIHTTDTPAQLLVEARGLIKHVPAEGWEGAGGARG